VVDATQADLGAIGQGAAQIATHNATFRAVGNAVRAIADTIPVHYNTAGGLALQQVAYHWYDLLNGANGVTHKYDDVHTALVANQNDWGATIQSGLSAANNVASMLNGFVPSPANGGIPNPLSAI
jgi:hypothetical protein